MLQAAKSIIFMAGGHWHEHIHNPDIQNTANRGSIAENREQRYGLIMPKRKEPARFYDNEDLKQILRVAYLYRNGYKISHCVLFERE